jgi:hypothetical protein
VDKKKLPWKYKTPNVKIGQFLYILFRLKGGGEISSDLTWCGLTIQPASSGLYVIAFVVACPHNILWFKMNF